LTDTEVVVEDFGECSRGYSMKVWKSKLTDFGWQEKVKVYANGSIVLTRYMKGNHKIIFG